MIEAWKKIADDILADEKKAAEEIAKNGPPRLVGLSKQLEEAANKDAIEVPSREISTDYPKDADAGFEMPEYKKVK